MRGLDDRQRETEGEKLVELFQICLMPMLR